MSQVTFNNGIMTLSGSLRKSDDYYFVTKNGRTYTCKKGIRTTPVQQSEIDRRERFARAIAFSHMVQANPEMCPCFRAQGAAKSVTAPLMVFWYTIITNTMPRSHESNTHLSIYRPAWQHHQGPLLPHTERQTDCATPPQSHWSYTYAQRIRQPAILCFSLSRPYFYLS